MTEHQDYYKKENGDVECIEAIKASMSPESFRGFLKGNVMKYIWRYEEKGLIEDLEKADTYLTWLEDEVDEWLRPDEEEGKGAGRYWQHIIINGKEN